MQFLGKPGVQTSDPLKQYPAEASLITGTENLSNSLLNMSAESSENLHEYLATTHGVLGMLQKEVWFVDGSSFSPLLLIRGVCRV